MSSTNLINSNFVRNKMRKQLAVSFTVNQEQSEDDTLYVEQDFPRFREEVTDIMVKRGWNSCMFASCTTDKRVTASVIMFPKTQSCPI